MKYDALFEPIRIGNLTLKNKFVMAPMAAHMTNDGSITPEEIAYYERRAQGGAAMLICGSICIKPEISEGRYILITMRESLICAN